MKFLLFLCAIFILWQTGLRAEDDTDDVCLSRAELRKKIRNCASNQQAVVVAKKCAAVVKGAWFAASATYAQEISAEAPTESNQAKYLEKANEKYEKMFVVTYGNLQHMQIATSLMATYFLEMFDLPEGKNDENSADCFKENLKDLQAVVTDMDREIVRTQHLLSDIGKLIAQTSAARVRYGEPDVKMLGFSPKALVQTVLNAWDEIGLKLQLSGISSARSEKKPKTISEILTAAASGAMSKSRAAVEASESLTLDRRTAAVPSVSEKTEIKQSGFTKPSVPETRSSSNTIPNQATEGAVSQRKGAVNMNMVSQKFFVENEELLDATEAEIEKSKSGRLLNPQEAPGAIENLAAPETSLFVTINRQYKKREQKIR